MLVVALGAYLVFSRSSNTDEPKSTGTLSSSNGTNPAAVAGGSASEFAGSDIAIMLKNINQIRLNTSVLNNPSFLALMDTSLTLPRTAVSGRVNPFSSSGASLGSATTQINGSASGTTTTQ